MSRNQKFLRAALLVSMGCAVPGGAAQASAILPPLKDGWWQTTNKTHTVSAGQPPADTVDVTYNCENAASWELGLKAMTAGVAGCALDIEGANGTYTLAMNCKNLGGSPGTMTSNATIAYAGDTALHMVSVVNTNMPALKMVETDQTVQDSKWLGACPAGVAPGDYGTMENGTFKKSFNALTNSH